MIAYDDALWPYRANEHAVVSRFRAWPNADANFHLWTAMAVDLTESEEIAKTHAAFISRCWVKRGLLSRWPGHTKETSWDEMFGAAYTGWFLKNDTAHSMLVYGLESDNTWDIERQDEWRWQYWFIRNISFIPFLRACAGLRIGQWNQILWALGAIISLFPGRDDTSGKNLIRMQRAPMRSKGWIVSLALTVWNWRMAKVYPGGEAEFLNVFIPGHPLADIAPSTWRTK